MFILLIQFTSINRKSQLSSTNNEIEVDVKWGNVYYPPAGDTIEMPLDNMVIKGDSAYIVRSFPDLPPFTIKKYEIIDENIYSSFWQKFKNVLFTRTSILRGKPHTILVFSPFIKKKRQGLKNQKNKNKL